jgi:FimV-like protein
MKIKKISFFLFFIIFSSLLSSEITYLSSKTFQDENAIQIVISINSTEEIYKSDISIFEYQTSSSIKDSLFNLSLSRVNISEYNLSFEKLKDTNSPYALFTIEIKDNRKDFFIFLSDDSYTSILQNETLEVSSPQIIEEEKPSNELVILADEITTVWSMAESLNYDDLSIYQVMWSIFENNRGAFIDDNINLIRNDMDILIPELQSIKEIDKSYAKFSIREMIDTNTFETQQMLTLVAPEPEAIIEQEIEVTQEEKTQNFDIQNQEQTTLDPQAIIESQTRIIEIERNEEIEISNEEINSGINILQLLIVSLVSLAVGFLIAIFLIKRNLVTAKNESKPDDALSSMPKGLSIKNDPFIQQFDLAITLYEMKDYEKAKTLLDEIIDKAKNQKLIQQAVDLRSKI